MNWMQYALAAATWFGLGLAFDSLYFYLFLRRKTGTRSRREAGHMLWRLMDQNSKLLSENERLKAQSRKEQGLGG